jgi:hypothetical protein
MHSSSAKLPSIVASATWLARLNPFAAPSASLAQAVVNRPDNLASIERAD